MTRDDIIRMAREIAAQYSKAERFQTWTHDFVMQRLMELVAVSAAAEREACAAVCDARYMGDNNREDMEARRCAAAIRARGQT
jgi:hypothetical protein